MIDFSNFEGLDNKARIWVFQADRKLTDAEKTDMKPLIHSFVEQWAAHGNQLFGAASIVSDYHLVFAVDDQKVPPSGCSIDSKVHFIKSLEQTFAVGFFNRLKVAVIINDEIQLINFADLSDFSEKYPDLKVFNTLVQNVNELKSSFLVKLDESPFASMIA